MHRQWQGVVDDYDKIGDRIRIMDIDQKSVFLRDVVKIAWMPAYKCLLIARSVVRLERYPAPFAKYFLLRIVIRKVRNEVTSNGRTAESRHSDR